MEDSRAERPLFQDMDETERLYAPESVPGAKLPPHEVDADSMAARDTSRDLEPPDAAPVAQVGVTHSGQAAPPNIGPDDGVGAPGDPNSQADYPMGADEEGKTRR